MAAFDPQNPDYAARVADSFADQAMMATLGARLVDVAPGQVTLELPFNPALGQQHGFHHAGATTAVLDSACGYAAFSLMPVGAEVLTVEFKTSLMAPAAGELFRFIGRVVKPGRTLMFTEGEAVAITGAQVKVIAKMSATMMVVTGRGGINRSAG